MTDNTQEQSAKIAHTTQELDHIVDMHEMFVDNSLDGIFDKMGYTKNTDFRKEAIRLITDWHNKQMSELLDRLESKAFYDPSGTSPLINPREIQAERNKLEAEL